MPSKNEGVNEVRAIGAGLPAKYEKQLQADQREMQRVYEFQSLTAEAAQCSGNSDSTGPLHGAPVPPTLIHDTKACEHLEGVAESTDV